MSAAWFLEGARYGPWGVKTPERGADMRNAPIRVQPATPMTAVQLMESWTPANPPGRPPPGAWENPYIAAADPAMGTMPRIGDR